MKTLEQRFWSRVDKTDKCWVWTGKPDKDGYGHLRVGEKKVGVHRFSYMLHHGDIPEGLFVCHQCDNPSCCNPAHLFLGTALDNNRDRTSKGRSATGDSNASRKYPGIRKFGSDHWWAKGKEYHHQGAKNGRAKLTESDVVAIRELWSGGGYSKRELGRQFNVTDALVGKIVRRKLWNHI